MHSMNMSQCFLSCYPAGVTKGLTATAQGLGIISEIKYSLVEETHSLNQTFAPEV